MIPDLVKDLALAAESDFGAVLLGQDALNLGERISLASGWRDASVGEPLVRWQSLEEFDRLGEEIRGFLGGLVAAVALGVKSADASAVLAPFVLPKGLVVAFVVLPVLVHVVKRV